MTRGEPALKAPPNDAAERLAVSAAQKDPRRFADLYEDNFDRVYAYIARRVHDRDAAEDLTADVFHRALKNISKFEWRGTPFAAWLLTIARNAIIDRLRAAGTEDELGDIEDPSQKSLETAHDQARLFRLVDTLAADQRRVIMMRFAGQRSIREIAGELRRTEGAIKQLQFRALQNLRERLSKAHG
jgi:RNA polymerase sigma-70 factor (ECF subfamily)